MLQKVLDDYIEIDLDEMRFPGFLEKRAVEIKQCVENVKNGKGWKDINECPVCSSPEREKFTERYGLKVYQCSSCGLGYMEKFPVDTADVYSHEDYMPIAKSDYLSHVDYRMQRFVTERLGIIKKYLNKDPKNARLIDVGCGTGWFLRGAKDAGYKVYGQEFGKELAANTAENLDIKVWDIPFTDIPEKEKFDVVTLFDVIEHVPNPREIIQSIYDHLNPGGIALLFTPNMNSLGFQKLQDRSSLIMPVEHLFYFTQHSLGMLIDEAGLDVLYFATKGMDIPDIFSHYRDDKKQEEVAEFLREQCTMLQAIIDASGCANHMRFVVQRRS